MVFVEIEAVSLPIERKCHFDSIAETSARMTVFGNSVLQFGDNQNTSDMVSILEDPM
jgi:hypothetical protein